MTRAACSSDLVSRARRGALAPDERMRLEAHLHACAACRLEDRVGADFDAIGAVRPGDDVRDARLADAVARQLGTGTTPRRRAVRATALVACLLLATGAAASAALGLRASRHAVPVDALGAAAVVPVVSSASPGALDIPSPDVAAPGPPAAVQAPRPVAPVVRPATAHADPPAPPVSNETASSIFEAANGERRRNHFTTALSLYDELQRRFPASNEAHVSHVSLGRLLLERGLWADAVPQLDAYLASGGTLAPEALFGKARALDALGQRADAEAAWRELLAMAPESVYAPQARQRLDSTRLR
jgi:TolA-binding protein